eukprot:TRINITY_DN1380_c0_g1_i1.p1 TRINITY_DN1380_c0_g1~~TRINITY_DN1380_c0_g1_i1.p1  ORF type:complete len:909 (-),score=289.85 TRINITY_DN1380_c0_g1_i1:329-2854(-)
MAQSPTPSAQALKSGYKKKPQGRRPPPSLMGAARASAESAPQPLSLPLSKSSPGAAADDGDEAADLVSPRTRASAISDVPRWNVRTPRADKAKEAEGQKGSAEEAPFDPSLLCYAHCRGKEPSLSRYYLGRDKPLSAHVEALCQKFGIDKALAPKYALQLSGNKHHIASAEFDPPAKFVLPPDTTLSLTMHPIYAVQEILDVLHAADSELTHRKMSVFQLRCKIVDDEDDEMLAELVKQGGVADLLRELGSEDTLPSYGSILLSCLARVFSSGVFPLDSVQEDTLCQIAKNVADVNVQLQRPALDAYAALVSFTSRDCATLVGHLQKACTEERTIYHLLVSLLDSFDLAVQISALLLINAVLAKATREGARDQYAQALDEAGIEEMIRNQIGTNSNADMKALLHDYQVLRLDRVVQEYNTKLEEEPSTTKLLQQGWRSLTKLDYPGDVSEKWKDIGFAGSDPRTELRNMLFLRNWLHYIEHYADHLRRMAAKSSNFPYSSASVGVTTQLVNLFAINNEGKKHVFPLLLNSACMSGSVFGELHALGIRQLATQWKNAKCKDPGDVKKLLPMMRVIFEETIVYLRPESLSKLKLLMEKQARDVSMLSEVSRAGNYKAKKLKPGLSSSRGILSRKSRRAPEKEKEKGYDVLLFGGELVDIMSHEREEDSTATVPRIISYLIDSLFATGGTTTEGIFRISVKMDVLVEMKQRLNSGDFDIEFPSAHYPAALLKQFLRDLKMELIPQSLYDACLNVCTDPTAGAELLQQLPADHLNVVKHVLAFLHELGKPEYNTRTKMGYSNLAVVFAPAFFRPDLTDQAAMLAKSDMEREFITNLLQVYPSLHL